MPRKRAPTVEGKPCKVCAATTRYKSNNTCVACAQARAARPENRAATRQWLRTTEEGREAVRRGNRARYLRDKEKVYAHAAVSAAIKFGKLPPQTTCNCAHCDATAEEYHHEDYSKPLDVIPLCKPCHLKHHAQTIQL